jgi:colicin import membrane protein
VHETATAWKDHDPAARSAAEVIRDQVQRRYGFDVDNLGADDASVSAALAKAERDREQAEQQRGAGRDENAQAAQLLAEAARKDQEREQDVTEEAGIKYDSAERRQELAASLEGMADREAVQARLSADQDQSTPPSAAVATALGRNPKARKTRGANGQTKLLQKGISR